MLTDPEDPPDPTQFWSWKKIRGWFLRILTILITALLVYDEKLEPYDDLKPTRTEVPDARTNGFLMLVDRWGNLPRTEETRKWRRISEGHDPWDDTLAASLNSSHRDLKNDLSETLAAKDWIVPTREMVGFYDFLYGLQQGIEALEAETRQATRGPDPASVFPVLNDLRHLSRREIRGASDSAGLRLGMEHDEIAGRIACDLLARASGEGEILRRLAACWADDQLTPQDLEIPAAGESSVLDSNFESIRKRAPLFPDKVFTRKNASRNLIHRNMRMQKNEGMTATATHAASLYPGWDRLFPFAPGIYGLMDVNFYGRELVHELLYRSFYLFAGASRCHLFQARAIRIAVAIRTWQLAHPGQLPTTLEELLPDYLTVVPLDPWDGRPLRWSVTEQIIYAVGVDWKSDIPLFRPSNLNWFTGDWNAPGLRLIPPPPIAPVAGPKTPSANFSSEGTPAVKSAESP